MIIEAYHHQIKIKHETLQPMCGRLIFKWKNFDRKSRQEAENWLYTLLFDNEKKIYDKEIYITNNGEAYSNLKKYQSVMENLIIKRNGVHRWDILIENLINTIYIGIYDIEPIG
ncbi:hypothetical protein C1645_834892 [Glomus cerebriforme]|uniref:Uncharacterized protein n=1 Tax=Glomus cerebriforme TaxID=658196 RepID=A0A397SIV7_9GLOM|nr:hypothetical protein C1645_834892 [Glomus cerebriforme]